MDIAADNDVLLKAVGYGLSSAFWPRPTALGILGSAPFVIRSRLARGRVRSRADPEAALAALLRVVATLEPTADELDLALTLERAAQQRSLALDAGESQLAAIVAVRAIDALQTGDKRGIAALEQLLGESDALQSLTGRVSCLEQVVLGSIDREGDADLGDAICREPDLDKALSVCFGCYGARTDSTETRTRLRAYIDELRGLARTLLAP